MTWVKICGITNLEDALVAVDAGADAIGFVFYEKSPRRMTAKAACAIAKMLPENVDKVGVFAGDSLESAVGTAREARLDSLQSYVLSYRRRRLEEGLVAHASGLNGLRSYVALPINMFLGQGAKNIDEFLRPRPAGAFDRLFLDSGDSQQPGGTGQKFDWQEAAEAVHQLNTNQEVVIAGGLVPMNVAEAIEILKPWGVDVSSGIEAKPGKKDPDKIRAFIKAVREADKANSN
jgi:phosphoribosylanthranilate isomerase